MIARHQVGVVVALAIGIFFVHPQLTLPAYTRFVDGTGPIFAGKIFPFCFITIACGAVSGFHSLISSGTTPKMLAREKYATPTGYGSMLLESLVAIMALIIQKTRLGMYIRAGSTNREMVQLLGVDMRRLSTLVFAAGAGLEAIAAIRRHADPIVAATPIAAMTALAMPGDKERCIDAGADLYMPRPVHMQSLLDQVAYLVKLRPRA
mgnify:CR=1 FL=1